MVLPPLTPEQRAAALDKAAASRAERARIKAALKTGDLTVGQAIERSRESEALARLRVRDLLSSLPGIGPARTEAAMRRLGIAESRRLRGLGAHQVAGLVEEFG